MDELTTSLRDNINRMFRYDFLLRPGEVTRSEMKHPSIQDEFASKQIEETLSFDEATGHYTCGLPWVKGRAAAAECLDVEASKWNAMDRLTKLRRRLEKDPEMKTAVFGLVKGIIDDGHVKVVDNPEVLPGNYYSTFPYM
jgi:hypothetical protein